MDNPNKHFKNLLKIVEDNWEMFQDGIEIKIEGGDGIDRAISRIDSSYITGTLKWDDKKGKWITRYPTKIDKIDRLKVK